MKRLSTVLIWTGHAAAAAYFVVIALLNLPWWKWPVAVIILFAIEFGCYAYNDRQRETQKVDDPELEGELTRLEAGVTALLQRSTALETALASLASYAATVRLDRRDETREYALQTVDWCEGLLEEVERAAALLTPKEAEKAE